MQRPFTLRRDDRDAVNWFKKISSIDIFKSLKKLPITERSTLHAVYGGPKVQYRTLKDGSEKSDGGSIQKDVINQWSNVTVRKLFSDKNIMLLQIYIRRGVYIATKKEFKVGIKIVDQDVKLLTELMLRVWGKWIWNVESSVNSFNRIIIHDAVEQIMSSIRRKQVYDYTLRTTGSFAQYPKVVNQKLSDSELFNTVWFRPDL